MSSFLKLEHPQKWFINWHIWSHFSFLLAHLELKGWIRSYAPIVPSKTLPDSRTKWGKSIPVLRPNLVPRSHCGRSGYEIISDLNSAKNPTLWGGTHLHGLYKGSPPPREVSKVKKIQSFISEADFLWVCWLGKKQASVVRINGSPYYWRFFLLLPKKELSPNDTFKFGRQRV